MNNSFLTIKYKSGYIHTSAHGLTFVQVDRFAYAIEVKSIHAAKMLITKQSSTC